MNTFEIYTLDEDCEVNFGGKGNGLRKMYRAGIDIPPFIVLSQNQSVFKHKNSHLNKDLIEELRGLLNTNISAPWAVRSSASSEDGQHHSFAGMFQSFLAINNFDALLVAVENCINSAVSDRVKSYCKSKQLSTTLSMSVLIQKFINPVVAGVVFTRHPFDLNSKKIFIEGNYGIGTSVVDGSVTPDSWVVNWDLETIEEKHLGTKLYTDCYVENKINRERTPNDKRKKYCIESSVVIDIAKTAKKVENVMGYPIDLEYIWDGNKVIIVQGRPITTVNA